jgi:hypothetical protein
MPVEENLVMGEREQGSGSGEKSGHGPEEMDEAREAEMMREIMRQQERHREGGIDPELDETDEGPGPEA